MKPLSVSRRGPAAAAGSAAAGAPTGPRRACGARTSPGAACLDAARRRPTSTAARFSSGGSGNGKSPVDDIEDDNPSALSPTSRYRLAISGPPTSDPPVMQDVEQDPLSPDAAEQTPSTALAVVATPPPSSRPRPALATSSAAASAAAAALERATAREQAALLESRAQEARELRAQVQREAELRREASERHLRQMKEKDDELRRLHESAARASRERAELRAELGVVHGELRALQRELADYTSGVLAGGSGGGGGGEASSASAGRQGDGPPAADDAAWRALRELHALSASLVDDSRQDAEQARAGERAWGRGEVAEGEEGGGGGVGGGGA